MTHASEFIDYDSLPRLISDGLITARPHPWSGLTIYNYSQRCQFSQAWSPTTLACRGLILTSEGHVISRPFEKFFNIEEYKSPLLPDIPIGSPFEAFEKADGSLAISYHDPETGATCFATRGSFESEQAKAATRWWQEREADLAKIPPGQTWLFEWIAPENRIVVDYKGRRELVMLAVIDNATGRDLPLPEWGGAIVRRFDAHTVEALVASAPRENFEGFVLRFLETNQRVKVKLPDYIRLHRILTQCSTKTIWEMLAAGQDLAEVLDRVPDEFYGWVRQQEGQLRASFSAIRDACVATMQDPRIPHLSRKDVAEIFKAQPYPHVLFKMLDGKDYAPVIWKEIRPEYARPFVTEE